MPTTTKTHSDQPSSDFAIIIPARYQSSRLPAKPLADIHGKPMIQYVWEQCIQCAPTQDVYIATDDNRIKDVCQAFGSQVMMTSPDCLTGTDRVAEAAQSLSYSLIVNVQGDEPLIEPSTINTVIAAFQPASGAVVNAMTRIHNEQEYRSPHVPKVVASPRGALHYMSRAPIPANKTEQFDRAWKQVCVYCFSPEHLQAFTTQTTKTVLEAIEDIELLRFLDLGIPVHMVEVDSASLAVDTEDDLHKVRERVRQTIGHL